MALTAVEALTSWFRKLSQVKQREVLEFLYGDALLTEILEEGVYTGPPPEMVKKGGLHLGPAPAGTAVCPRCGRPF